MEADEAERKDNRNIVDNNQNQKLSVEDVEAMKAQKADGAQIID